MTRSVLLIACRWLRRQIDAIERMANAGNGAQREPQVSDGLGNTQYLSVMANVNNDFQGYVGDSISVAISNGSFEEYLRGVGGSQQGYLGDQINYSAGQNFVSHNYPPDYSNQQLCAPTLMKRKRDA